MLHANSVMITTLKMTIKLKGVDTNNQCHNVYAKVVISDYVHTCWVTICNMTSLHYCEAALLLYDMKTWMQALYWNQWLTYTLYYQEFLMHVKGESI